MFIHAMHHLHYVVTGRHYWHGIHIRVHGHGVRVIRPILLRVGLGR